MAFHTAHELLLLAHSAPHARRLGRLVAGLDGRPSAAWFGEYVPLFMQTLAVPATAKKHVAVLRHVTGRLERRLDAGAKRELLGVIEDYRGGLVPLVVPITLLNHYVARFEVRDLLDQVYLRPHPSELMLRGTV